LLLLLDVVYKVWACVEGVTSHVLQMAG